MSLTHLKVKNNSLFNPLDSKSLLKLNLRNVEKWNFTLDVMFKKQGRKHPYIEI